MFLKIAYRYIGYGMGKYIFLLSRILFICTANLTMLCGMQYSSSPRSSSNAPEYAHGIRMLEVAEGVHMDLENMKIDLYHNAFPCYCKAIVHFEKASAQGDLEAREKIKECITRAMPEYWGLKELPQGIDSRTYPESLKNYLLELKALRHEAAASVPNSPRTTEVPQSNTPHSDIESSSPTKVLSKLLLRAKKTLGASQETTPHISPISSPKQNLSQPITVPIAGSNL